jgi:hypothetical protein
MVDHGTREHAQWSASSTERNWQCSGALALTDGLPEKNSEAADWGTACHQISEKCLRGGLDPTDFIGTTEKGKVHEFEVDEEMANTAMDYVSYVRHAVVAAAPPKINPASLLQIEQRFSLADLKPPFEAGGTADAVVYWPREKQLEVIDLKGGRGHVVEVVGNPQLRTYALGAMLANGNLMIETIKVTIVQPRAPHKSGRTRSETFHVADLVEWTAELLRAMHRAKDAMLSRSTMNSTLWEKEYLAAGDHCKFCKAAGFCPALERKSIDAVGVWFDDLDQPRLANTPDMLSPERAAQLLDAADMIDGFLNAVRAYWHAQAEMGVEIPNYVLVDKIGRRKWRSADEAMIVLTSEAVDVDPWERKMISPAQAEKRLGTKRKGLIADLIETPVNGTNLTRADKTTRKAATPSVNKHFSVLD